MVPVAQLWHWPATGPDELPESLLDTDDPLLELDDAPLESDDPLLEPDDPLLESDDELLEPDDPLPESEEPLLESDGPPLPPDPLALFDGEPLCESLVVCEPLAWESSVDADALLESDFDPDPLPPDETPLSLVDRLVD